MSNWFCWNNSQAINIMLCVHTHVHIDNNILNMNGRVN